MLVKSNRRFGAAYLALIRPFRYVFVYPALMRTIGRAWRLGAAADLVGDRSPVI